MQYYLRITAALIGISLAFAVGFWTDDIHAAGISQLDQWISTTSPSSAITQNTYGKAIKITGLTTGQCLTLNGSNVLTTTTCGSSSGDPYPFKGFNNSTSTLTLFNGNASTTAFSATQAFFGGTATSTFTSAGSLGIGTSTPNGGLDVRSSVGNVLTTDTSVLSAKFGLQPGSSSAGVGLGVYTGGYGTVQGLLWTSTGASTLLLNPAGGAVGIGSASSLGTPANTVSISGKTSIGSGYWGTSGPTNGLIVQGNTGIGTSTAFAKLSIHANNGDTNTTLFAIGSSTAAATTTLFTVDNAGVATALSNVVSSSGAILVTANNQRIGTTIDSRNAYVPIGASSVGQLSSIGDFIFKTGSGTTEAARISGTNQNIGIGTTSPYAQLSIATPNGSSGSLQTLFVIASSTPTATSTLFSVNNKGSVTATDPDNNWTGRVSPTRRVILPFATSTATWTGTSTPGVDASVAAVPRFAGTVRSVSCTANTFLGINIKIGSTSIAPSYFVASSTVGTVKVTGSNTFTATDKVTMDVGTTTTATASSGVVSGSCTLELTETP
jgi:hypothetical protein